MHVLVKTCIDHSLISAPEIVCSIMCMVECIVVTTASFQPSQNTAFVHHCQTVAVALVHLLSLPLPSAANE